MQSLLYFYAIIYGSDWDTIEYYNDLNMAFNQIKKFKLNGIYPFIQEYTLINGRFTEGTKYEKDYNKDYILNTPLSSSDSGFSMNL